VAQRLVVGIFPQSDPKALETALSGQQVDLSKVKVVSSSAADTGSSALEFVDVMADMESNSLSDDMTRGMGIMGDSGGTGVPGIGGRQTKLDSFSSRGSASKRYLAAFSIPMDEVDNFDQAVAEGRAVVLYPDSGADTQSVVAAFRAAGLRNVRAY
jgi:rhodanese-related sulfurtransferase